VMEDHRRAVRRCQLRDREGLVVLAHGPTVRGCPTTAAPHDAGSNPSRR
jgi:hypothetical protein